MAGKAIPYRLWVHTKSGHTASAGGAGPWNSPSEKREWKLETRGWTVLHPDGTQGIGRGPFATKEAAEAWIAANPHFPGMNQG